MRNWIRLHKRKHKQNPWDENDTPKMLDEYRVVFGEHLYLQRYMQMGIFEELLNGQGSESNGLAVDDSAFEKAYPLLYALMCRTVDDAGKQRQVATLTIVCEDGQVKCGVAERNYHLSLWISAGSLGGVFAALEGALTERPVAWRKVSWKGKGGRP